MNLKMVILKALTSYILFKTCWFGSHSVFSRYLSNRRFDFFFISALNIINVTSPVSVDRESEFIKWRTNENRVRTSFALSTWQHNIWRGGDDIVPVEEQHRLFRDRRIVISFQLGRLSRAASSYWCLFQPALLFDIQFRDSRTPAFKKKKKKNQQ